MSINSVNNLYTADTTTFQSQKRAQRSISRHHRKSRDHRHEVSAALKCAEIGTGMFGVIYQAESFQKSSETLRPKRRHNSGHRIHRSSSKSHKAKRALNPSKAERTMSRCQAIGDDVLKRAQISKSKRSILQPPPPPPQYPHPITLFELLRKLNLHESHLFVEEYHLANARVVSKRPLHSVLTNLEQIAGYLNQRVLSSLSLRDFLDLLELEIIPSGLSVDDYYSMRSVPQLLAERQIKVTRSRSKKGGSELPFFIGPHFRSDEPPGNETLQHAFSSSMTQGISSSLISPLRKVEAPRSNSSYREVKAMNSGEYSESRKKISKQIPARDYWAYSGNPNLVERNDSLTPPPPPLSQSPIINSQKKPKLPALPPLDNELTIDSDSDMEDGNTSQLIRRRGFFNISRQVEIEIPPPPERSPDW